MPKRNTEHWQRAARHDYSVHLQLAAQLHLGELHQERQGVIEAKGVTFYNFRISSGSSWQGVQIKDTDSSSSTDLTMEYGEIVGGSGCSENVHGMGWTARYMEIHDCDDNAKVHSDGTNGHGPVLVEYSWLYNAWGGHGDNFQNVTYNANDPITVRRNSIEGGGTSVMLLSNIHTVTLENNWTESGSLAKYATAS